MKSIQLIELELFNYCNRACSFCPNSKKPDRRTYTGIDIEMIKKLIKELKEINYTNYISFSRYNEPFFKFKNNIDIFKYIRDELNCKLVTNTNGDFLDKPTLKLASEIFDEITIMNYDNKDNYFDWIEVENVSDCGLIKYGKVGNCKIAIAKPFFDINDRGGILDSYSLCERKEKCYEPKKFIGIDYNGNVMPCCNVRSDFEEHKKYSYGNIKEESIVEIVSRASSLRDGELRMKACAYCTKKEGRYTRHLPGLVF